MERTTEEIVARINELRDNGDDFWGFIRSDLANYLVGEDMDRVGYKPEPGHTPCPRDAESVSAQIADYMAFAWQKANRRRGLSAGRSLNHMSAWLWMLGEEAAADQLDDYSHYGKPQLRAICEHFDIDWRSLDDGRWTNYESEDGGAADSVPAVDLGWAAS